MSTHLSWWGWDDYVHLAHATLDLRKVLVDGVVDGARAASLARERAGAVGDRGSGDGGSSGDVTGTGRDSGQSYGIIVA